MRRELLLLALPVAAFGAGYYLAPKEQLAREVQEDGFFRAKETNVLSATVESLKAESSLVVWSFKGTVTVKAKDTDFWILESEQTLIVPASVDYRLPLDKLTLANVNYNETAKLVTVKLPKLVMSDVAFQPESATTISGGLLTMSDDKVQALNKRAYSSARRAFVAQAQQKTMVGLAQAQAAKNVAKLFEIPLRIAGHPDVKVVATFD